MKFLIFCWQMYRAKRRFVKSMQRSVKNVRYLQEKLGCDSASKLGEAVAKAQSEAGLTMSIFLECQGDMSLVAEKSFEWALSHPGLVKAQLEKMG